MSIYVEILIRAPMEALWSHTQTPELHERRDLRYCDVIPIMSRVSLILIAKSPSLPMESQAQVLAVPGKGLAGDRYFDGTGTFSPHPNQPDFELTLIETEKIECFAKEFALAFTAYDARRNIVTEGVDLNALAGKEFMIGSVRIRGMRLCEPCNYLAKKTHADTLRGLIHKGGLRAQIISEGFIRCGDSIGEIE
ncbi:MAG: MOSC domain-containing protein [Verrucomicrobia bacterium]|nr:MOSC domain-containing protein [Verrucomicrobiota bacterium]